MKRIWLECLLEEYPAKGTCDRMRKGWWCTGDKGHEGPCAARPTKLHALRQLIFGGRS